MLKMFILSFFLLAAIQERKLYIQQEMKRNFGVRVDYVLQGKGTSNTGNVAKKCLKDPILLAKVLQLNEKFVQNLSTILLLFAIKNSRVDMPKLKELCVKTNAMFYKLYPWARMRPSVHKFLLHGCDIADKFQLPQAYYAEDALEHLHKATKNAVINNSRQTSNTDRLNDTFQHILSQSDPLISLLGLEKRLKLKKKQLIPNHALEFIINQEDLTMEDMDMEIDDIDE